MDAEDLTEAPDTRTRTAPAVPPAVRTEEERQRVNIILAVGQRHPLDVDHATVARAIDRGVSADAFRAEVYERMVQRQDASSCFPHNPTLGEGRNLDNSTDWRWAMAEGLYARVDSSRELSQAARQFRGMSLVDAARECLSRSGERVAGESSSQILTRGLHSTSDFPVMMGLVGGFSVMAGYDAVESGIREVCGRIILNDFREHTLFNVSGGPRLLKVNEHGEYKRATVQEGKEALLLMTYGRIIGFTRQLIINDQLGQFARLVAGSGRQVAELELDIIVGQIVANPKLGDGNAVFHADHGNLGAPAALSIDSLKAARLAFRRQKDRDRAAISVTPRYLIVPPELETAAEVLLTSIQANRLEDVNVFGGKLSLIVEGRLTDPTAWYLAADPDQVDGIQTVYLAGNEQPFTESRAGFDVDGMEFKVRHDFAAALTDHRGWYRNPGA